MYEKEDFEKKRQDEQLEKIFEENITQIKRSFKGALRASRDMGYGFVVIDRDRYLKNSFNIRDVSWLQLDDCLRNIGARGGLSDKEEAKCRANRKRHL
jgi:hypothetical protein